jgi:hypothetical protein
MGTRLILRILEESSLSEPRLKKNLKIKMSGCECNSFFFGIRSMVQSEEYSGDAAHFKRFF